MNLVTGATGHIGNVLIRQLLQKNKPVRALVMPYENQRAIKGLPVEIFEGDVLDAQSIFRAMEGIEVVYHLAGIISIMPGRNDHLRSVNIMGTRNIILACQHSNVKRFIYTSSIHALRRIPKGKTIDENTPFDIQHALSEYDQSKAQASLDVMKTIQEGLDAVIVCPTGVIGPYDYGCSDMGRLILDCLKKKPQFYVDGAYDFVDVRDVANGLIQASEKGRTGETYILSGEKLSIPNLVRTLQDLSGFNTPRFMIPMSLARIISLFTPWLYQFAKLKPRFTPYSLETLQSNSDISHAKAETVLNYHPRPLINTIRDTMAWFRENHTLFNIAA